MKKVVVLVTGCLLFMAGYYQARRQTEYMTTNMGTENRAQPAKPMVVSHTRRLFAFRLKQSIFD